MIECDGMTPSSIIEKRICVPANCQMVRYEAAGFITRQRGA